ncbi:MAG: hypothetical protein SGBAC_007449 [Bacillariaceae sp.]
MGLRFTEEPTTAVYEFEKMTWDEMDEIFYTDEEIGDFRHSAFMIECGLEEEDWSAPDVEPVPWPKEVDELKIKNFATNKIELKENQLKAKRQQAKADVAVIEILPTNTRRSNESDPVEAEIKPLNEADPVSVEPPSSAKPGTEDKIEEVQLKKFKAVDSKDAVDDDLKSSAELQDTSARTATTESTSTHDSVDIRTPTTAPLSPPRKNPNSAITKQPMTSPKSPMKSPIQRSYSMDTRRKDKTRLDNIVKSIKSPTTSPKQAVSPTMSPKTKSKPEENREAKKGIEWSVFSPYKAPLAGSASKKIPLRSLYRTNSLKKGSKKNRTKVLDSLNATSMDDEDEGIVSKKTKLKPTKSADLEHMRWGGEDDDKPERKLKRNLMRTTSGSISKVQRKPRKGKKANKEDDESPSKLKRRMKKGGMQDSSSSGLDLEGSPHRTLEVDTPGSKKKKKRSSLSKQSSQRSVGSGSATSELSGSMKQKKRSSLKRQASLKRSESVKSTDSSKKKRSPLKRTDSSMSAASTDSKSKSKRRGSLKRQTSLQLSERSAGSSERIPRRGMKKEESMKLKKEKSKKKNKALTREDSESSMSEEDLNDAKHHDGGWDGSQIALSPIREPTSKRGISADRSLESQSMSSISSGVSFLGSIDSLSVGSDRSIETVDDDEDFDIPARPAETDDESDGEIQEEFYRYMKSEPTRRLTGAKVYTVYKEKTSSHNGKTTSSKKYVCASLVLNGSS